MKAISEIHEVQGPVVKHAKRLGWLAWKMRIEGRNGCPDYWFFRRGHLVIIEFKAPGKKPSPQQALRAMDLEGAGFAVRVIDNALDGLALFDAMGV